MQVAGISPIVNVQEDCGCLTNSLFQGELHRVLVVSGNHNICLAAVFNLLQHILQTPGPGQGGG